MLRKVRHLLPFPESSGMKILLVDHHELFRNGLHYMLRKLPGGVDELLEAADWQKGLQCVEQHPDLDMVLLEIRSHGCRGVSSVKLFRERYPHIPLVVVSGDEDTQIIAKVLHHGASGFVGKSAPETQLLSALKLVSAGDIFVPPQMLKPAPDPKTYCLTRRQIQMLGCLTEGLSNKEISRKFGLAEGTVKVHVAAVYQALRVRNRREAVGVAFQIGMGFKPTAENYKRQSNAA